MKSVLFSLFALCICLQASAQSIGIGYFFKPGLRLHATYDPTTEITDKNTSEVAKFGNQRYQIGAIVPLGGEISFKPLKLKVGGHQNFLTANAAYILPQGDLAYANEGVTSLSLGITRVSANLLSGIMFYTANVGLVSSVKALDQIDPYAIAAIGVIKVKGIKRQNFMGLALSYNNKKFLPVPFYGINRKLSKRSNFYCLLPLQMDYTYKISSKLKLDVLSTLGGYNCTFLENVWDTQTSMMVEDRRVLKYNYWKNSMLLSVKLASNFKMILEGGMTNLSMIDVYSGDQRINQFRNPMRPFFNLSVRTNMGGGFISSQMFGNDL